jgi:hypothetical protein
VEVEVEDMQYMLEVGARWVQVVGVEDLEQMILLPEIYLNACVTRCWSHRYRYHLNRRDCRSPLRSRTVSFWTGLWET